MQNGSFANSCQHCGLWRDFYLCPLSALQAPAELIRQVVEQERIRGSHEIEVVRLDEQGKPICIAKGYETALTLTEEVDGQSCTWQERRLVVQSLAAQQVGQASLQERLQKSEQALANLTTRRQGKARLRERHEVEEVIQALLKQFRVEGLLQMFTL